MITLYKLCSGETIIGVFTKRERRVGKGESVVWVRNPMVINLHSEIVGPWMPGSDITEMEFPIIENHIIFYIPEKLGGIQEFILQEYKSLIEYENE